MYSQNISIGKIMRNKMLKKNGVNALFFYYKAD